MGWPPDDEYPTVAQSGRPYEDARSPEVELVDAVARLKKDLAEFRTEFGYGGTRRPASMAGCGALAIRLSGALFWMSRFLSCHRGGERNE